MDVEERSNPSEPEEAEENNNEEEENLESTQKAVVAVKKRIIKNPQPKFNAERLCGPRGITDLLTYHSKLKFRGEGYEKEDLDEVLSVLQQWTHRLFPKMPFDASLEQIENLGKKKETQVHVAKIRMGMPVRDSDFISEEMVEDELPMETEEPPQSQYDPEALFRQLEEEEAERKRREAAAQAHSVDDELTEEQRERMRQNQEMARKRKKKSMRVIEDDDEGDEQGRTQDMNKGLQITAGTEAMLIDGDPAIGQPDSLSGRNRLEVSGLASSSQPSTIEDSMQDEASDRPTEFLQPTKASSDESESNSRLASSESEPSTERLEKSSLEDPTKLPQPGNISSHSQESELHLILESESEPLLTKDIEGNSLENLTEPSNNSGLESRIESQSLLQRINSRSSLIEVQVTDPASEMVSREFGETSPEDSSTKLSNDSGLAEESQSLLQHV